MLVWWNSKEGKERLSQSAYANHFYTLAHLFERQVKPTYCGIASAVMVLNALRLSKRNLKLETRLDLTLPDKKIPFNCYTQITFFNDDTLQGKCRKKIEGKSDGGMHVGYNMDELHKTLRLLLLDVKMVKAKEKSAKAVGRFRHDLMAYLNENRTFVIVNFDGRKLGNQSAGHYSPIVAYHPSTDSCLVMDVASHKNPWFWVTLSAMYEAMHTKDGKEYRGYMVISDKLDK
jgi:hypothetical protein